MLTIGIDIGGTKIAGGLVAPDGTLSHSQRVATPETPAEIEDAVVGLIDTLRERGDVGAVGVAAAGFMNHATGVITGSPNIAWHNEPLRGRVAARIALPTVLENDANAAGWAEYRFGAGRGTRHMVMLTMGTGIGGAIVIDGALQRGSHGMGAELGHMRFERNGLMCGCGQRGCIEQYASGRALQRLANELADAGGVGSALAAAREAEGELSGHTISRLVAEGDRGALEALRTVAAALGEACGSFHAILEPERFVIGGGVSVLGDVLLYPMREAFRMHKPNGSLEAEDGLFHIAELVNDAGVIGAGDLARLEIA